MLNQNQFLGPGVSVHCLLTDWAQLLMLMLSLISRALKRILSDVSNRETERIVFSSFEHLLIYIKNDISENSLKNDIQAYYITLLRNQKVTADSKLSMVSKAVQLIRMISDSVMQVWLILNFTSVRSVFFPCLASHRCVKVNMFVCFRSSHKESWKILVTTLIERYNH